MIPLSLQLWTLNDITSKDFAGTVAEVAKLGFKGVELAGTGNLTPKEAAKVIKDLGLKVSGAHIGWDQLTGKFEEVVQHAELFGTKEVILPWMAAEHFASVETCTALGEQLGALGAKFRAAGLRLSYHNHGHEFALVDGRPALEWLIAPTSVRDVSVELDLYWVFFAGYDPLKAVTRFGARARLLHLKDGANGKQSELGRGGVNFPAIFELVEKNELTDWYVIEQEQFNFPRLESVRLSVEYLRGIGRA
jgi:sugar phosphate isomerase/epimerase